MAYNQRNKLRRIVKIQNLTLEHTSRGVTQVWVFNNIVKPRWDISISTYYNYLGKNAKKLLGELEEPRGKQLTLFE